MNCFKRLEKLVPRSGKNIFPRLRAEKKNFPLLGANFSSLSLVEEWKYWKNEKKHSVALFFLFHAPSWKNLKVFGQFFHVISITKSEPREHYQPSACGLGLAKFSLGSLFVILITWKIFSHTFKFFYESGNRKNNATKYNFCASPVY